MPTTLAAKLQLKSASLLVLNAPEGMAAALGRALDGVAIVASAPPGAEAVLAFARDRAEAEAVVPQAIAAVRRDGLLWFAYPKGSSSVNTDLNRETFGTYIMRFGWHPVRQVALDETWSALRFRPPELVGR